MNFSSRWSARRSSFAMLAPLLDPLAPSLAIPMSLATSAKADNRANPSLRTRRFRVISLVRSSVAFEPVHSVRKQLIEIPQPKIDFEMGSRESESGFNETTTWSDDCLFKGMDDPAESFAMARLLLGSACHHARLAALLRTDIPLFLELRACRCPQVENSNQVNCYNNSFSRQ